MIKWLTGFATIAALLLFFSATDEFDTDEPTLSSSVTDELLQTVKPALDDDELSVAEIRWCMSQYIWLQTTEARLGTDRAIDRYNALAAEFNPRCIGYEYQDGDRAAAQRDIDGARAAIVAAALEEIQQLNGGEALTRTIQELLELAQYKPGAVDGVYGPQTKAAIEAYQHRAGMPADGLVSQALQQALRLEYMRHLARGEREPTSTVTVRVTEEAGTAVADAKISLSNAGGLLAEKQTNEQGRAAFVAVPAGRLDLAVRRNQDRARFSVQVTEEPRQEVLVILPAGED